MNPWLSNEAYDKLKWTSLIALPAAGTLYFVLATIWGFPNGKEVVGTIAAINIFLSSIVGITARSYNRSDAKYDGAVMVTGNPETPHTLVFNQPLSELEQKSQITLKITSP